MGSRVIPYLVLYTLLSRLYKVAVFDRCVLDFVAWIVATLNHIGFVGSVYGRFLLRLARSYLNVYLYADLQILLVRADIPRSFLLRELGVYRVLSRHLSYAVIDTGSCKHVECLARVIRALKQRGAEL